MFYIEKLANGNVLYRDENQNNKVVREWLPPCTVNTGDRERIFITRNSQDQFTINLRSLSKLVTTTKTTYIGGATTLESVAEELRTVFFRLNNPDLDGLSAVLGIPNLMVQAALGALESKGVGYDYKFGRNGNITTTSDPEDIIPSGLYTFLETSDTFTIVSDSTEDNPSGLGMGTIEIKALDANYNPITIEMDLNGVTPVVYSGSPIVAINTAYGIAFGSNNSNMGFITIDSTTDTLRLAAIVVGKSRTTQLAYTVRAGYVALLTNFKITGAREGSTRQIDYRMLIGLNNALITKYDSTISESGSDGANLKGGIILDEKENIVFRVDTVANTQVVTGYAEFLLIKKELLA